MAFLDKLSEAWSAFCKKAKPVLQVHTLFLKAIRK